MKIVEVENLTNEDFEFMCGGVPYIVKARSSEHFEESIAEHGRGKSICSFDPLSGDAIYRLSIVGVHDDEPLPDDAHKRVELLDREAMGDNKARAIDLGRKRGRKDRVSAQTPSMEGEAVGALTPTEED